MEEFVLKVVEMLQNFYGSDATVGTQEVLKNNDQHFTGVTIRFDSTIAPVIYMEPFFEAYKNGADLDKIVEKIVVETNKDQMKLNDQEDIAAKLGNFNFCKDKIYPVLISTERNQSLLEQLVSKELLDLSVIYAIRLSEQDEGMATVKVTKDLIRTWGVSAEELHNTAVENMADDGYCVKTLASVLAEMIGEDGMDLLESQPGPKLMVMCNRSRMYSAAGVLDSKFMSNATHGKRCYMIPSSVHQWLMVPDTGEIDPSELDEMVRDVNSTEVSPDEILSSHVYLWNGSQLQMCA